MSKYVRLNKEKTETISPFMAVRPSPLKHIPDSKINDYGWYKVQEVRGDAADPELYSLTRTGWSLKEPLGDDAYVEVTYTYQLVSIEQQRAVVAARCHKHRDGLLSQGLMFRGKMIDTQQETKHRILSQYMAATQNPTLSIDWITADNTILVLDAVGIQALATAFADFESVIVGHARSLKDQIYESITPTEFNYQDGWPIVEYN